MLGPRRGGVSATIVPIELKIIVINILEGQTLQRWEERRFDGRPNSRAEAAAKTAAAASRNRTQSEKKSNNSRIRSSTNSTNNNQKQWGKRCASPKVGEGGVFPWNFVRLCSRFFLVFEQKIAVIRSLIFSEFFFLGGGEGKSIVKLFLDTLQKPPGFHTTAREHLHSWHSDNSNTTKIPTRERKWGRESAKKGEILGCPAEAGPVSLRRVGVRRLVSDGWGPVGVGIPYSTEVHWCIQNYTYKLGCYARKPHRCLLEYRWIKRFVWLLDTFSPSLLLLERETSRRKKKWSGGRLTKTGTDHLWPELWRGMSKNAKLREKQKWSKWKAPSRERTKITRNLFHWPWGHGIQRKPLRMFERNWKHQSLPAMLCRTCKKSKHGETHSKTN